MYVRQEAYYNSVPDGQKITRAEKIEQVQAGILTTGDAEIIDDDSADGKASVPDIISISPLGIQMPPIPDGSEYLISFLHSAGTATATGMGLTGLSWSDIYAWVKCTGMEGIATTRDLKTVHMLSRAYASEAAVASQKWARPPYSPPLESEELEQQREEISNNIDAVMAGIIAAQNSH